MWLHPAYGLLSTKLPHPTRLRKRPGLSNVLSKQSTLNQRYVSMENENQYAFTIMRNGEPIQHVVKIREDAIHYDVYGPQHQLIGTMSPEFNDDGNLVWTSPDMNAGLVDHIGELIEKHDL